MDNARQQIVDSIKKSSNILVTVSTNPSVDELSAALGLSIILNNQEKRATAVFSGAIPPAISFLEPNKTFESSADSLRDFIIALDKEKADHLRYKVDGDVVKIFITPYKVTLSQADLEFSQGDYNVDLVIALGVTDQDHLDKALEAHGKILHDAAVMTIMSGAEGSKLGSVDWHDDKASSLSEMIVGLAEGIKGEGPVFDAQIATALLTGIVSATARFSNERTTSRAMTMAAQLMAAGANQQLIAAKLEEAHDIAPGSIAKTGQEPSSEASAEPGSELTIKRDSNEGQAKVAEPPVDEPPTEQPVKTSEDTAQQELEKELAGLNGVQTSPKGTLEDIENELKQATDEPPKVPTVPSEAGDVNAPVAPGQPELQAIPPEPATLESVPDVVASPEPPSSFVESSAPLPPVSPAIIEPPVDSNPPQIVNEHGKLTTEVSEGIPPINSIQDDPNDGELPTVDPFNVPIAPQEAPATAPIPELPAMPDISSIVPAPPAANTGTPEGAAILGSGSEPAASAPQPTSIGVPQLPPLPPLPTDITLPPLPPPPPPPPTFGQGGPTDMPSGAVSGDVFGDGLGTTTPPPPAPTTPPEPGQYKIPGS